MSELKGLPIDWFAMQASWRNISFDHEWAAFLSIFSCQAASDYSDSSDFSDSHMLQHPRLLYARKAGNPVVFRHEAWKKWVACDCRMLHWLAGWIRILIGRIVDSDLQEHFKAVEDHERDMADLASWTKWVLIHIIYLTMLNIIHAIFKWWRI